MNLRALQTPIAVPPPKLPAQTQEDRFAALAPHQRKLVLAAITANAQRGHRTRTRVLELIAAGIDTAPRLATEVRLQVNAVQRHIRVLLAERAIEKHGAGNRVRYRLRAQQVAA